MPLAVGARRWQALAFSDSHRNAQTVTPRPAAQHRSAAPPLYLGSIHTPGPVLHPFAPRRLVQTRAEPGKQQPEFTEVDSKSAAVPPSQSQQADIASSKEAVASPSATGSSNSSVAASTSTPAAPPAASAEAKSPADAAAQPSTSTIPSPATVSPTASSQQDTSSASTTMPTEPLSRLQQQAAAVLAMARNLLAALAGLCLSLVSSVRSFPAWVQAQQLKRLKELHEEEPNNAERHAAYLAELNKVNPKEVVARVDSGPRQASSPAVVVEYIKALVATGKLAEYASTAPAAPGESHRSLAQLLKELQQQAAGEAADDSPGSSVRRPLHVTLQGAAALPMASKPAGPMQALWGLASTLLVIVGLAFAWLVGSQAVRRVSAQPGLSSGAVPAASGSPSTDPKEYKKDELPETSIKTFKDVLGCDESKAELQEIVEFLKNPAKFTRLGAKLPRGVLLTGPPGTGKTLLAKAVAGEAGVPFFYRAGSEFEELYVGVGSRRMRALFAAAKKKAPCIVFIDEIDAIGGNRKHWESHTRKTLNQLLVEMDGFEANEGVIVLAATNLPETLDPALKRPGRFDRQVAVPLPDIKGRSEILKHYLKDKPVAADIDVDIIARQTAGFSGADLSNLVNEAALLAAKEGKEAISGHMVDYSYDKIKMGVERKSVKRSPEAVRRTAYHESGHAIVALNVPGAIPIHKATIVPRGHALGMVTQVGRDDEFSINKQQMLARILVCMGGQVAEELIFGREQVTSGATDDLRQATEMARHMVMQCGLNEAVGPVYVADEKLLSEKSRQQIDAEVRSMLVEARDKVRGLLTDKLQDLHSLAGALLDKETLTASEIQAVLAGSRAPDSGAKGEEEPALVEAVGMVAQNDAAQGGSNEQ